MESQGRQGGGGRKEGLLVCPLLLLLMSLAATFHMSYGHAFNALFNLLKHSFLNLYLPPSTQGGNCLPAWLLAPCSFSLPSCVYIHYDPHQHHRVLEKEQEHKNSTLATDQQKQKNAAVRALSFPSSSSSSNCKTRRRHARHHAMSQLSSHNPS